MMKAEFLHKSFADALGFPPTEDQDALFRDMATFIGGEAPAERDGRERNMSSRIDSDGDILVVNGYAGTGKTSALSAVIHALEALRVHTVLLAPTGRAAKVLAKYSKHQAYTIHKHIYRQKSHGDDGFGQFSLSPNKAKNTLFIVDEVSLIGVDQVQKEGSAQFGSGNLLADLVTFVRNGIDCKLVLCGDDAQLPPVGLDMSPALSPECMEIFGGVQYSTLSQIVRQQKESGILHNATKIRKLIAESDGTDIPMSAVSIETEGYDDIEHIGGSELIDCISSAYSKYGEEETIILCRSNKRANRYNMGVRSRVLYKEESLLKGDRLMIVKNNYQFLEEKDPMDYMANGDLVELRKISNFEERYGLHFADAVISFPDYDDFEIKVKAILDVLESESPSLSYEQSNALYQGVSADYAHIKSKKKRYDAVREDPYFNGVQFKYAEAVTCHKSQGGQWDCVFIDNPFWMNELCCDDLKWLYTALTRAVKKVYLVNFKKQ